MLEQVVFPRPHDAFSSTHDRVEVYGVDLDDSDAESAADEDPEVDSDRIRRACSLHAITFITNRDISQVESLLQTLRPAHRHLLVEEFVMVALQEDDVGDAFVMGSLFSSPVFSELCMEANSLFEGLTVQLSSIEDTSLDVPHALRLMAHLLQGTDLPFHSIEHMIARSLAEHIAISNALLAEIRILQDSDPSTDAQESTDDNTRRNRFERGRLMP